MTNNAGFTLAHKILALGIIAIATVFAYGDIVNHQFLHWDDMLYIHNNKYIHNLNGANLYWMFTNYDVGNWHPLTWLSLALDFSVWGYNPLAFKLVNLGIHIINSVLVYHLVFTLLQLTQRNYHAQGHTLFSRVSQQELTVASLLVALLFAIHPQHVESVSWIAERKEVLCGLFFLATILAYIQYRVTNNKKWLTTTTILFFCSLMAKPMAVTLPLVLILIDIYPLKVIDKASPLKQNLAQLLKNKWILFLLSTFVALITLFTQRHGIQGSEHLSLDSRIVNACMTLVLYVYKFIWPANLSPFYPFHPWSTEPNLFSLIPVLLVILLITASVVLARKKIYYPLAILLYIIITLLPVIGLIKVGSQAAADRYTYLSLLSLIAMLGGYISAILHLAKDRILIKVASSTALCLIVVTFGFFTFQQNKIWQTDFTLWEKAIALYPGLADRAYSNLGEVHLNQGNYSQAINYFHKALAIQPENSAILEKTGKAHERLNNDKLAAYYFNVIIHLHPEVYRGYMLLGDLYYSRRNVDQAKAMYNKAFSLTPDSTATLQRKALVDYLDGNLQSALQKIDYLLMISPDNIGGLQLSAKIHLKAKNINKAAESANRILDLKPDDSFAKELLNTIQQKPG